MNRYAEHGLKPGRRIIVLTFSRDGVPYHTSRYLYDTAASWAAHGLPEGVTVDRTDEPWDGTSHVTTDNGD